MTTQVDDFKTDDMALVTYLRMHGHQPVEVVFVGNFCTWRFEDRGHLPELVREFQSNEAVARVKEYSKHFKTTRSEFYEARDLHRGLRR